jgi:hypothetical protein
MLSEMIEENMKYIDEYEFISNQFEPFLDGSKYDPYGKPTVASGVLMFQKKVLKKLGGFKPWPCSADSNFNIRSYKIKEWKRKKILKTLFKVRIHPESMTNKPSTRQGSKIREKYNNENRMCHLTPEIYTKPFVNYYKEI